MKRKLLLMTPFGPIDCVFTEEDIFKEASNILTKEEKDMLISKEDVLTPTCVGYYIASLAKKMGWKPQKMANYIQNLWSLNPAAAFSVLLREIAVELDKQYKDHINNCEELFVISVLDGRIHKTPRAYIKNFRNFAAFRTEKDAKLACRILREELKEMFKSCGK